MKPNLTLKLLSVVSASAISLSTPSLYAQDSTEDAQAIIATATDTADDTTKTDDAGDSARDDSKPEADSEEKKELKALTTTNSLRSEKLKAELAQQREEVERLKLEKQLLEQQTSIAELRQKLKDQEAKATYERNKIELEREATLAKLKADLHSQNYKSKQAEWNLKRGELEAEVKTLQAKETREAYIDSEPNYLENPLKDDGTLVISDRRIPFNGVVTSRTADFITSRLHFYNNQDPTKPIFIVIDDSPGGSVMAGYRILKAMEASDAPVHVVVKSFAASMAASITTLAEHSYAYPNAIILHHQISSTRFGRSNLTEQKEALENMQEWWKRLATPIANKMGISIDELVEQMYEADSQGDWVEFADKAIELKWVDHIVERIEETSTLVNPDKLPSKVEITSRINGMKETVDERGETCIILPRLNPKDVYFMHNPDHYYRLR